MSGIPILVHAERVTALVVGGGAVAARKVASLVAAGAAVRVVAPAVVAEIRTLAAHSPTLTITERAYEPSDVVDADLVFAATDAPAVNAAVASDARGLRRLVTVADSPDSGTFTGMAVHEAGEVVVAVSAGGVPTAAARIRDLVAAVVEPGFGDAVASLRTLRRELLDRGARARWRDAAASLTGAAFCDDVRAGRFDERVAEWR